MDIYQLRTLVAVAREGSIKRASELLHLSQPSVSAHVKLLEDTLGVTLFERTPRGMTLTRDGERLLAKAEKTLAAHQELVEEAARIKGRLAGRLRIGANGTASELAVQLVTAVAEKWPEIEIAIHHLSSLEVLAGLRNGTLDAGFYNGEPEDDLVTREVSRFTIHVAAPRSAATDWSALAQLPWIYPTTSTCCGNTAEALFRAHGFRPQKIISIDREHVTRTLVANGLGVGLLHDTTAREAAAEVQLVYEAPAPVRVLFAHLASRTNDPLVGAARESVAIRA
jgi:DNA-binding transcriptional LysR family regulator